MTKPVEIIVKEENKEHLEKLQQFYVKLKEEEHCDFVIASYHDDEPDKSTVCCMKKH